MICHDVAWHCPRRTRLYINYLGKVYGKNALDFHFWNASDATTAQVYCKAFLVMSLTYILPQGRVEDGAGRGDHGAGLELGQLVQGPRGHQPGPAQGGERLLRAV